MLKNSAVSTRALGTESADKNPKSDKIIQIVISTDAAKNYFIPEQEKRLTSREKYAKLSLAVKSMLV